MKKMIKRAMETKVGKIAVVGGLAFTIFSGGAVSASYIMKTFDSTRAVSVQTAIDALGNKLMDEKAKRFWFQDDATAKQTQIADLNNQITALNAQIAELEQQVANGSPEQQAQIDQLNAQVTQLQSEKTALESENTTMESDINKLNSEIDKANNMNTQTKSKADGWMEVYNDGQRGNGSSSSLSNEWEGKTNGQGTTNPGNPQ